ncbi:hypothetical protein A0J57_20520 [Sphingobium sp. 22B]|uniref:DUF1176 domain-containing protein n=1 Tax=unclassified Sphingobium TaxID=2611147 RepID=UPI000783595E|nr:MULTISPECIES: DUF1176 domain-containing protein [unclassified Sphingobium]KXU29351.1 hypothetical protein AXW74_23525 [Sphingobium sp. AM]KYC30503.1 hypothetical protein A0J57_20520 [Sphingobium sp. 22B]OAP30224.1 hypothetical protein A8O16_19825 [Sphingobium sp. 20006FA]
MGAKRIFELTAMLSVVMAAAPAGAQAPKPGRLESYKDWTIGCDNGNRCEAVSLLPEGGDWPDAPVMLGIARGAGADADPEIRVSRDAKGREALDFLIDGRKLARVASVDGEASLEGPQASALAIAMAKGGRMEIRAGARAIDRPSLAGLTAALRYMDAKQGRAGTMAALVATGPLARSAVRPAPAIPTIRRVAVPGGAQPPALWREELTALGIFTGCADEMRGASSPPELHRLSKTETLVLVPCGAGAYNFTFVPAIATGIPGRRTFRFAGFDYQPGWSEEAGHPMLVNAGWAPETSTLQSYAKGRGLGDCGGSETYVWDGSRFRLVEASAMGECRGAWHWITTWSAKVTD